jgi:hypothetical protein
MPKLSISAKQRGGLIRRGVVMIPHRDCRPLLREYQRRLFAGGLWGAYSLPLVVPLGVTERALEGAELKVLAGALREGAMGREGGSAGDGGDAAGIRRKGTTARESDDAAGSRHIGAFSARFDGDAAILVEGPGDLCFCGLSLNIPASVLPVIPGMLPYPALILCTALIGPEPGAMDQARKILDSVAPPPPVTFRAASVANLILRPLDDRATVRRSLADQLLVRRPPANQPPVRRPLVNQPEVKRPTVNQPMVKRPTVAGDLGGAYSFEWETGKPCWLPAAGANANRGSGHGNWGNMKGNQTGMEMETP